jgi:hypothetical protein
MAYKQMPIVGTKILYILALLLHVDELTTLKAKLK